MKVVAHQQVLFNINILHRAGFISLLTAFRQAKPSAASSDFEYFSKYGLENNNSSKLSAA